MSMVMGRQKSPRFVTSKRTEEKWADQEWRDQLKEWAAIDHDLDFGYNPYDNWTTEDGYGIRSRMREETRRALEADLDWLLDHELDDLCPEREFDIFED